MKNAYVKWRHSRIISLIFTVLFLLAAYLFASLAIDTGSLWYYALTLGFVGGALYEFLTIFRRRNAR